MLNEITTFHLVLENYVLSQDKTDVVTYYLN
jgi:hypothetical protein